MRLSILVLAFCAACATNRVQGSDSAPSRQVIFQSDNQTFLTEGPRAEATEVDSPPLAVWAAVKKVYLDLDIPLTTENAPGHQLGNNRFQKTHQLGGERMERLVNCGNGMTGPNAASFRITMSLMTDVNSDGHGGSKLQTTLVANGQDISGASSYVIPCGSSGLLEQMVLNRTKLALGRS